MPRFEKNYGSRSETRSPNLVYRSISFSNAKQCYINNIVYCGFSTNCLARSLSAHIAIQPVANPTLYQLTRSLRSLTGSFTFSSHRLSLIFLLCSSSFAFFESLLRNSWDARLTSHITVIQWHIHYFPPLKNHTRTQPKCMKTCIINSTFMWT